MHPASQSTKNQESDTIRGWPGTSSKTQSEDYGIPTSRFTKQAGKGSAGSGESRGSGLCKILGSRPLASKSVMIPDEKDGRLLAASQVSLLDGASGWW
jgi:hypothetical protein